MVPSDARRVAPAPGDWFWAAFALCAVAALVPLWSVKYLPMIDLPQHGAQVAIWKHLDDPRFGFAESFELHYFTPYFAFYGLARFVAVWTSVLVAMKAAISVAVLALPLSLVPFLARTSASRWWSLLGFPLAYGTSFDWGFATFMLATPVAFLYLTFVVDYARAPTGRRAAALAAFTVSLFWVHGLLVLFCPLVAGVIVLRQGGADAVGARRLALVLAPLASPVPVMVAWYFIDRGRGYESMAWQLGPSRFYDLFALTALGSPLVAVGSIVVTGVAVALRDRDPARARITGLAYAACVLVVLFCPGTLAGVVRVSPRFAVFLLPLLVAWLGPSAPRAVRVALVAGVVAWMGLLVARFRVFDRDARDYDVVAGAIRPAARVRPIIFLETKADAPFVHFPAWTQAEKGGVHGLSFASNYSMARLRPNAPPLALPSEVWNAPSFDWRRELAGHYDYYVVRSRLSGEALTRRLFEGAHGAIQLLAERGMWHVYADARAAHGGP